MIGLKKVSAITAILAVVLPVLVCSVTFVADTVAFQLRVERRWLNDDIIATRKRIWSLEREFPEGDMPTAVTAEYIRLRAELDIMYRQLEKSK